MKDRTPAYGLFLHSVIGAVRAQGLEEHQQREYKKPSSDISIPLSMSIYDSEIGFDKASENMRFAYSMAALGLYLRNSAYKGSLTLSDIKGWASNAKTFDPNGYRSRHLELLQKIK